MGSGSRSQSVDRFRLSALLPKEKEDREKEREEMQAAIKGLLVSLIGWFDWFVWTVGCVVSRRSFVLNTVLMLLLNFGVFSELFLFHCIPPMLSYVIHLLL